MHHSDVLPRFDLREEAFRKYELLICRAATEASFEINPKDAFQSGRHSFAPGIRPMPMSQKTFISRFLDAMRGYALYHYKSTIPSDFNPRNIKFEPLINGNVRIINKNLFALKALGDPEYPLTEQGILTLISDLRSGKREQYEMTIPDPTLLQALASFTLTTQQSSSPSGFDFASGPRSIAFMRAVEQDLSDLD